MNIRSRPFVAACLVLAVMATGACGRKSAPLVPDSPRPEAVKDIKAVTRDTIAVLSWSIPTRNIEGKSIGPVDIQRFRIYRAEFGRDQKKVRYRLYSEIDMASPSPASVRDGTVVWNDRHLKYGTVYGYRVRALSVRGGISTWSDEVRVAPLLSLAVPTGTSAKGGDSFNHITWAPVTTRMDGSRYEGFVGYNVYRGTETGRYEETPLNKEPLRTNLFKDTTVSNDRTYYYVIRAVDSPALPWKESLDSDESSATPRDLTPPARPMGLTVVPGLARTFLLWNENKERDLAGYLVYRSLRSGGDYEMLTDKPLTRTTFSDETVKSGATYYYRVTAVDKAGNESDWSEEKQASVEQLR